MNGYLCFYRCKKCEVHADTQLKARDEAAKLFQAKHVWEVTVCLAEKQGVSVACPNQFL